MEAALREALRGSFILQSRACARADAPMCAAILTGAADEVATVGGVLDPILTEWRDASFEAALPLRILGALHRLALDEAAPPLAALLPTTGGFPDPAKAWPIARELILSQASFVRSYLDRPPQTNEVGRSAALLGGFLEIAAATGLPLRLLELGASAGLNLCWDRHRVETTAFTWGPGNAALTLRCEWRGKPPTQPHAAHVVARHGCDRDPVDLHKSADRQRLESYIWADQPHRLARLRTAANVALAEKIVVNHDNAEDWLPRQLATLPRGVTTVVYHSLFWQYLAAETQARLESAITEAATRASTDAPLAWLRMEMPDMKTFPQLILTLWPGGQTRQLATVHFHGDFVHWNE